MELRVLTWNISGHNSSKSSPAPLGAVEKHLLVAEEVLRHAADVITLQEVPLCEWGGADPPEVELLESLLGEAGYTREAKAESHSGFVCIYLHNRVRQHACSLATFNAGPAAGIVLELTGQRAQAAAVDGSTVHSAEPWHEQQRRRQQVWQEEEAQRLQQSWVRPIRLCFDGDSHLLLPGGGTSTSLAGHDEGLPGQQAPPAPQGGARPVKLCLAGFHLEAFDESAPVRLRQLRALLSAAADHHTTHLVVAGDANMRERETQAALELGGLQDAHMATGQRPSNAHTWDTTVNRYYGEQTRAYTARYDRVFCSTAVMLRELQLVANRPLKDGSYLSDHFGLLCTVAILAGG